jgi:hypothetical protein
MTTGGGISSEKEAPIPRSARHAAEAGRLGPTLVLGGFVD